MMEYIVIAEWTFIATHLALEEHCDECGIDCSHRHYVAYRTYSEWKTLCPWCITNVEFPTARYCVGRSISHRWRREEFGLAATSSRMDSQRELRKL